MSKRLAAMAVATGVAAASVALGPVTAANAAPIICEPGYKSATWTNVTKGWKITHAEQYNIPQHGTGTLSKTATYRNTVHSSRQVTGGANYAASFVIHSFDANISGSLAKAGEKTKERNETVTLNFNKAGDYVVFSGVKKVTGYYKAKTCNDRGTGFHKVGYGKAQSWVIKAKGAVKCTEKPKKGTAKSAAKKFC